MGVDVVDGVGAQARVLQAGVDRPRHPVDIRIGQVAGIRAHPETDHLGDDLRAAGTGAVKRLKHDNRRALAHHEALAVLREGAAGVGRHDAEGFPAFQRPERDARFRTSGYRGIRNPRPHHLVGEADSVGRR